MKPIVLTKSQARKIILHAGGLSKHGQFGKGKEAVSRLLSHLDLYRSTQTTLSNEHTIMPSYRGCPTTSPNGLTSSRPTERCLSSGIMLRVTSPCATFGSRCPSKKVFVRAEAAYSDRDQPHE